jgi:MoxR-like ATPase
MEERQVTIDGVRYALPEHFTVLATQNPIEFEGTYPLPEAQLDRFLLKIRIPYPTEEEEIDIVSRHGAGFDPRQQEEIALTPIDPSLLAAAKGEIAQIRIEPALYRYIVGVIRRTRDWPAVSLGASPRAAVALFMAARTLAGLDGRDYLLPDDVKSAASAVLRHRLVLKPEADMEGITPDLVVQQVLESVEIPK